MLYHQNRFAQVNAGSRCLAISHTLGRCTSLLDCRQNLTSHSSRKYQPFPTIPCSLGQVPVRYVACPEQVTAGITGLIDATAPRCINAANRGVASPIRRCVSPTALMTTVLCMGHGF